MLDPVKLSIVILTFMNHPRRHHKLLYTSTFVNVRKHESTARTSDKDTLVVLNNASEVQFEDEEEQC